MTSVVAGNLISGMTKSCGCLQREAPILNKSTHGMSKTPEFRIWANMLDRCRRTNRKDAAHYSLRGIRVCARWQRFEDFFADMGPRPAGTSLDRIDPDGHYEPGNVRWISMADQQNNKRNSRFVEFRGEKMTAAQAVASAGNVVSVPVAIHRIDRGWPVEDAVSKPPIKSR